MDPNDTPNDPTTDPADDPSLIDAINQAIADPSFDDEDDDELAPTDAPEPATEPATDEPVKAEEAKPEEAKPAPTVDDEIKDLGIKNERTAQRFRDLSAKVESATKEVAQLSDYRDRVERWEGVISSTGATPEDFGSALEILSLSNQGTRQGAEGALALIDEFRSKLAARYGIDVAGVDPLQGFDDLTQRLQTGDIDQASAKELARLRRQQDLQRQEAESRSTANAHDAAIKAGSAAVDTLCAQLKASDPTYDRKFEMLKPLIEDLAAQLPPAQWAGAFKKLYDKVQLPAIPDPRRVESPAPIRRSASNGGDRTPTSAEEAVRQALGL